MAEKDDDAEEYGTGQAKCPYQPVLPEYQCQHEWQSGVAGEKQIGPCREQEEIRIERKQVEKMQGIAVNDGVIRKRPDMSQHDEE